MVGLGYVVSIGEVRLEKGGGRMENFFPIKFENKTTNNIVPCIREKKQKKK